MKPRRQRGDPYTTTLPGHMSKYVQGLADLWNLSVSATLARIVQEHFDQTAEKAKKYAEKIR